MKNILIFAIAAISALGYGFFIGPVLSQDSKVEYALQITVGALIVMSLVSAITADYLVRFTCPSPGMLRYTKIMLPFEVGGSVFLATLTAAVWSIPAALFFAVGVCLHHYGSLRIIQRNEKATQN